MRSFKSVSEVPKSVVLNGDLMLKRLDASHAEALFALADQNRSYLKRWLPWLNLCINRSDTLNFITSANDALLNNSRLTFGIFYKEKISGVISFRSIDLSSGKAEIGYWIGEAFQGLGLVTCACAKLIEIGFKQLDLQEISIRCGVTNIKSQKIPTRLGFKKVETILKQEDVHGVHMDLMVYITQKDQWLNQQV